MKMHYLIGIIFLSITHSFGEHLRSADIEALAEALVAVADTKDSDAIKKLYKSVANNDPAGLLVEAYDALELGSGKRATATEATESVTKSPTESALTEKQLATTELPETELPKTELSKTELPKTQLPKTELLKTESPKTELLKTESTEVSDGISSIMESSTQKSESDKMVVDRKRFESLANQMKQNSDELVQILRTNAATVVKDFIRIAHTLENQIRAKSNALLVTVHLSADELESDNEKLASVIDKVYSEH